MGTFDRSDAQEGEPSRSAYVRVQALDLLKLTKFSYLFKL